MNVSLCVIDGPNKGRQFEFQEHDTFIVGRAGYAHFQMPARDKLFSRAHFMVEVNPPLCRLIDMASSNGTFVNEERVTEIDLRDGDQIRGGNTIFRVSIEGSRTDPTNPNFVGSHCLVEAPVADPKFTNERIGNYQILRELGQGGMGVVYLASQLDTGRQVALKMIRPGIRVTDRDRQRFVREATVLEELRHLNIVRFENVSEHDDMLFFAMEYVEARDCKQILEQLGPLDVTKAVSIILHVLAALDYAHSKGFVHRDIKPANILVATKNRKLIVKLADFGLARAFQQSAMSGLTLTGDFGGCLPFVAPEQITNFREATPSADLYSASATLYTLLTNEFTRDYSNNCGAQLASILNKQPIPIESKRRLPSGLAEVIHKGLAKDPNDRFKNAVEMRHALKKFAAKK